MSTNNGLFVKCPNRKVQKEVEDNIKTQISYEYEVQVPNKLYPRKIFTEIQEYVGNQDVLLGKIIR